MADHLETVTGEGALREARPHRDRRAVGSRTALAASLALLLACGGSGQNGDGATKDPKTGARPVLSAEPSPSEGAGGVAARLVARGFKEPTHIIGVPGDPNTLLVTERAGRVRVVRSGRVGEEPFLDLRNETSAAGPEQGMQSIAFHPDYPRNGLVYVFYTDRGDDLNIVEFGRADSPPLRVDPGSRRLLLHVDHPTEPPAGKPKTGEDLRVHNGGQLAFGPDGYLYVGTGDAGGQGDPGDRGQDLSLLLGKLLRIDVRPSGRLPYRIPPSNPFVGQPGKRPEIFAYGLRNPFRFSFDRATGDLVIGDVGQFTVEEINFLAAGTGAGSNFGWSCYEGRERFKPCEAPGHIPPIIERPSSGVARRCASIIAGFVARGAQGAYGGRTIPLHGLLHGAPSHSAAARRPGTR